MGLYSILMTLITTITILIALTFEDIYVSFVIFGLLSIIAIPVSDQYKLKENEINE
ncbi:hypothetical protein QI060_06945 [Staphylococcus saprophyticus]|uniref:hypothetical protein n=1 Tax=Staphylococcus saprophyticus TaxID=29385 RepID=UPI002975F9FD|nr:hypothetical protein [Staphylococcus saprophyticus]MDW4166523.1 hypothetical protein [Staphylococcus saprophyticus]MDW4302044.1 hypothetical protein [Staphylococcus saprophyticus]MEB5647591.1 hypothetical protein [Staphylococcus saprophyticus]